MDFKTGGQKVIERLVEVYGFTTRQVLCDHLGVSKSTLATRYMRDLFPAEWVVQCALETGVELKWLTTGHGNMFNDRKSDIVEIENVVSIKKLVRIPFKKVMVMGKNPFECLLDDIMIHGKALAKLESF